MTRTSVFICSCSYGVLYCDPLSPELCPKYCGSAVGENVSGCNARAPLILIDEVQTDTEWRIITIEMNAHKVCSPPRQAEGDEYDSIKHCYSPLMPYNMFVSQSSVIIPEDKETISIYTTNRSSGVASVCVFFRCGSVSSSLGAINIYR